MHLFIEVKGFGTAKNTEAGQLLERANNAWYGLTANERKVAIK